MSCGSLGRTNVKKIWAVAETTCGTLKVAGATDYILPAGTVSASQVFPTVNSDEVSESLDILEQFQNAAEPAEFSFPMYLRVPAAANLGDAVQGDILFKSMTGGEASGATGAVDNAATWLVGDTTLHFDTLAAGWLPDQGVILCETEQIYYRGITWTSATEGDLLNCSRGYMGTTAAAHADDVAFSLTSRFFKQDNNSPSFSLWIQFDHFMAAISGCSVNSTTLGLNNEGAVMFDFSGQGMEMFYAGTDALTAQALAAQADIVVNDARRFKVGMYIQNITTSNDGNNTGAGYLITEINTSTNTITLGSNVPAGNWAALDVIVGMYPATDTSVPNVIESRYTTCYVDGVATTIRSSDLTIGTPKIYPNDEIGQYYPSVYAEDKRDITGSFGLYFRGADAGFFTDGRLGTEKSIHLLLGTTEGEKLALSMRKVKIVNPIIGEEGPILTLDMDMTVLGTISSTSAETGENSLELSTC